MKKQGAQNVWCSRVQMLICFFLCALLMGCGGQFHAAINPDGIIVDISFNDKDELEGETNLPDGTILYLEVMHPVSEWKQEELITVQNGRFTTAEIQRKMMSPQSEIAQVDSPSGLYLVSWKIMTNPKIFVVKSPSEITLTQ